MSTQITTSNLVRTDVVSHAAPAATTPTHSRGWALAGIGAGLAGIGMIVTSSMVDAVYDEDLFGDPAAIADKLADQTGAMFAFHGFASVCAVLVIVFAAGLFRRLRDAVGRDSLAPLLAFAGLVGTGVVLILGAGLNTEFISSFVHEGDQPAVHDANAAFYNNWIGTIPWCFVLAGLAGTAIYTAARTGGAPRWIGRVGLVLGGLTLVVGISPLQYMAAVPGVLLVLVTATGFAVGDKAHRGA
jgi:hypothetical protein